MSASSLDIRGNIFVVVLAPGLQNLIPAVDGTLNELPFLSDS